MRMQKSPEKSLALVCMGLKAKATVNTVFIFWRRPVLHAASLGYSVGSVTALIDTAVENPAVRRLEWCTFWLFS